MKDNFMENPNIDVNTSENVGIGVKTGGKSGGHNFLEKSLDYLIHRIFWDKMFHLP